MGETLQDNIIDIVMRFRLRANAITADLQKMYRQILLHRTDRDYQRILWRFSPGDPISEYQLNTVTYSQVCAPFLAVRCVRQLAEDETSQFSRASKVLLSDLYVDDIITGVESEDRAMDLILQLEALLLKGGFKSHKWHTNSEKILRELKTASNRLDGGTVCFSDRVEYYRDFRIEYYRDFRIELVSEGRFQFSTDFLRNPVSTKREILSAISRLFDPLGLIGPILVRAKLIMQETWASNLEWDEPLTNGLRRAWDAYAADLRGIGLIRVSRRVIRCSDAVRFCIHAFCDASLKAYGACIYLQAINNDAESSSLLLCLKLRVSPVGSKTITLPRLELCGAIVLVRLLRNVQRALKIKFDGVHAWNDSTKHWHGLPASHHVKKRLFQIEQPKYSLPSIGITSTEVKTQQI